MARQPRSTWWRRRRPSAAAATPRAARRRRSTAAAMATAASGALAYTQGSEARVALPARDDGGAVVAHLACNGERFFVALPVHALWAEHDARVAAEVLQPHIDPITEIVAVIDRDLVGNDLAIDTIHSPAMRLHGMTELLAVSVAILALCTAVHLVGARAAAARPSSAAPSCRRSSERAACSEAATRAAGSAAPAARAARRSCGRAVGARAAPRWSICACDYSALFFVHTSAFTVRSRERARRRTHAVYARELLALPGALEGHVRGVPDRGAAHPRGRRLSLLGRTRRPLRAVQLQKNGYL